MRARVADEPGGASLSNLRSLFISQGNARPPLYSLTLPCHVTASLLIQPSRNCVPFYHKGTPALPCTPSLVTPRPPLSCHSLPFNPALSNLRSNLVPPRPAHVARRLFAGGPNSRELCLDTCPSPSSITRECPHPLLTSHVSISDLGTTAEDGDGDEDGAEGELPPVAMLQGGVPAQCDGAPAPPF